MQERFADAKDKSTPDIYHMLMLIEEAKVALRSICELVPDPQAIDGLIQYVRDVLNTIARELERQELWRTSRLPRGTATEPDHCRPGTWE